MLRYFKLLYYSFYRPKIFFPKKSYSMFGEDKFIQKYYKNKKKGFYIDVGAYHPLDGSNTQLLYKKGWSGINLDINYYSIKLFNFLRKRDRNIHSGVSIKKGKLTMFYRKEINMLNTLDEKMAKINFRKGYYKKHIQVDTLDHLLKKNLKKNDKIDFINIDAEGLELKVLRSLNFKIYKPQLICVEIHNVKKLFDTDYKYLKTNGTYNFLIKKGYKVIWKKNYSFIFQRKKFNKKRD